MTHARLRSATLLALAAFLGAVVLSAPPAPRRATLGRGPAWSAPRPTRRPRVATSARALAPAFSQAARRFEPDPSRRRPGEGRAVSFRPPTSARPPCHDDGRPDPGRDEMPRLRC